MTLYAQLMKATGRSYLIENCHWGACSEGEDSSCPTEGWVSGGSAKPRASPRRLPPLPQYHTRLPMPPRARLPPAQCPFNWYRTSGDINSSPMSWLANLQTTIRFQDPATPLSRPGCWAYPDMLEVGRIAVGGQMHFGWNRAHFGAWCVVSAPLILGLDVTQPSLVAPVIDIITNPEAIAVNQAWAGHPGALVWSALGGALGFPAARTCDTANPALKQVRRPPHHPSPRLALAIPCPRPTSYAHLSPAPSPPLHPRHPSPPCPRAP